MTRSGWQSESRRRKELPPDWGKRRKAVLARDKECVFCGRPATDVDHIDPRGGHELENLRALCHHCHMSRTQRQSAQSRKKGMWQTKRQAPHRPPRRHPGLK